MFGQLLYSKPIVCAACKAENSIKREALRDREKASQFKDASRHDQVTCARAQRNNKQQSVIRSYDRRRIEDLKILKECGLGPEYL